MMKLDRRVVGFRFLPTDEELVVDYLLSKVLGFPLPSDDYVKDCNLYGDLEPWDIWKQYFRGGAHEEEDDADDDGDEKKNDLYFFTPLKKRTATGTRLDRSVGSNGGSWHEENVGKEAQTLDGAVSWTLKRFSYRTKKNKKEEKKPQTSCCSWIMHEYCLLPIPELGLDSAAASKLAVCRLRKKESSKKRKNNNNKSASRVILIHDAAYSHVDAESSIIDDNEAHESQGSTSTYKRRKLHGEDQQQVVVSSSSVEVQMQRRQCLLSGVNQGLASDGGRKQELQEVESSLFQKEIDQCSSEVKEDVVDGKGNLINEEEEELDSLLDKEIEESLAQVKEDDGVDGNGNEEEEEELDSLFDKEIEECLADVKEDNGIDGNGNQGVVSPSFQAGSINEGEGAMTQQQSVEMELVTAEEAAWWSAVSASAEGTCNVNNAFGFNYVDCPFTVEGLLAECSC
ncbi:unnamed protein product [Linum trigynum]|uniref:NAC domain-containing protein n=1 Tax=Linum trigynum TaxID=586398 RepID=A0AAV2DIS7_9ROSI